MHAAAQLLVLQVVPVAAVHAQVPETVSALGISAATHVFVHPVTSFAPGTLVVKLVGQVDLSHVFAAL